MVRKQSNYKLVLALVLLALALNSSALASDLTINFGGLYGDEGLPFTSYTEFGFMASAVSNNWIVAPWEPVPLFFAQPDQMIAATIAVTEGGASFTFRSIDLYSSITTIPYTFTGLLAGKQVFTVSGKVPNTFGNFATVMSPYSGDLIDTLDVTLTDSTPPCCSNRMGLDNIVVGMPGSTPEPASMLLLGSGITVLSLLRWRRSS